MGKLVRVALGTALLLTTAATDFAVAAADDPQADMLAVVVQRDRIDQEMGQLPGVFVSTPNEGVLGVQVKRDALPEQVQLDMLRIIGQRADMDRGQAEAPR